MRFIAGSMTCPSSFGTAPVDPCGLYWCFQCSATIGTEGIDAEERYVTVSGRPYVYARYIKHTNRGEIETYLPICIVCAFERLARLVDTEPEVEVDWVDFTVP